MNSDAKIVFTWIFRLLPKLWAHFAAPSASMCHIAAFRQQENGGQRHRGQRERERCDTLHLRCVSLFTWRWRCIWFMADIKVVCAGDWQHRTHVCHCINAVHAREQRTPMAAATVNILLCIMHRRGKYHAFVSMRRLAPFNWCPYKSAADWYVHGCFAMKLSLFMREIKIYRNFVFGIVLEMSEI